MRDVKLIEITYNMLSVRVVTVDYYMSKPVVELRGEEYVPDLHSQEPVIRIFGPTAQGVKTCVHIHGVHPYMYVPCQEGENPERDALLLEAALDQAFRNLGNLRKGKYVYKVKLESGIPLYGYHSQQRQLFKIYFFNPYHVKKASELLLSGGILGRRWQPHEAHVPFTLQFMMDYNIYGMSFVDLSSVRYRRNPERPESLDHVNVERLLPAHVKRTTFSFWEVDSLAENILNREHKGDVGTNPGLQAIWEDEKARRKVEGKSSLITPEGTQTRPAAPITTSERLYKERLASRLKDVTFQEQVEKPAEAFEDGSILDVSGCLLEDEQMMPDTKQLIDEEIISQIISNPDEDSGSDFEEVRIEADSVLGRNREDEEEEEPDEEDGGDMTQPLDQEENVIADLVASLRQRGRSSPDEEESFWKAMADKIMQLDGTEDSTSGSEDERSRWKSRDAEGSALEAPEESVERMLASESPESESISSWSNNIMSILSEPGGLESPPSVCQTPQSFWSNWSSKMHNCDALWSSQQQTETWSWDNHKSTDGKREGDSDWQCQSSCSENDANGNDMRVSSFPTHGEYLQENYTPTLSPLSPLSPMSPSSPCTMPPLPAVLTPVSEMDINLDSASQVSASTTPPPLQPRVKTVTVVKKEKKIRSAVNSRDLIKNWKNAYVTDKPANSLTLRQFVKSHGEIVNVDFKTLNGKEMVVIEYKPINGHQGPNKFLIKPLERFLQEWTSAEKTLNGTGSSDKGKPKLINGFTSETANGGDRCKQRDEAQLSAILNMLEHKYTGEWVDKSKIESMSKKFRVETMEILPEETGRTERGSEKRDDGDSYKVNQNVISGGKIKMKIVKSFNEGGENGDLAGTKTYTNGEDAQVLRTGEGLELRRPNSVGCTLLNVQHKSEAEVVTGGGGRSCLSHLGMTRSHCGRPVQDQVSCRGWTKTVGTRQAKRTLRSKIQLGTKEKDGTDRDRRKNRRLCRSESVDAKLIEKINRRFEDYFRESVKIDSTNLPDDRAEVEFEESEEEDSFGREYRRKSFRSTRPDLDSVKFASQLLSALTSLSALSQSTTVPPLSITINLGTAVTAANLPTPPIHLNIQPPPSSCKRQGRKLISNSVDGPADSDSSGDSTDSNKRLTTPTKKKAKKDSIYRPLNVFVEKPPTLRRTEPSTLGRGSCMETFRTSNLRCGSRESTRTEQEESQESSTGSKLQEEPPPEDLTKSSRRDRHVMELLACDSRRLSTIISDLSSDSGKPIVLGDSGNKNEPEGRKSKSCPKKRQARRRVSVKGLDTNIPQSDVTASTSSTSDEELENKGIVLESDAASKSQTSRMAEQDCSEISLTGSDVGIVSFYNKAILTASDLEASQFFDEHPGGQVSQGCPERRNDDESSENVDSNDSVRVIKSVPQVPEDWLGSPFPLSGTRLFPEQCPSPAGDDTGSDLFVVEREEEPIPLLPPLTQSCVPVADTSHMNPFQTVRDGGEDSRHLCLGSLSEGDEIQIVLRPSVRILTKRQAPSACEVRSSLSEFGIRENAVENPFYSDPKDISKPMQVGNQVLKISNHSIAGLKKHKCSLDVTGTEERREALLNFRNKAQQSIRSAVMSNRDVILKPLSKPPSRNDVAAFPSCSKKKKDLYEPGKKKILLPLSPGQDSGSEEDLSLSMTMTPTPTSTSSTRRQNEAGTPTSIPTSGPSGIKPPRRVSFDEWSWTNSPSTTPSFLDDGPRHSTPNRSASTSPASHLKKGPLEKIKGRRKLLTMMQTIAEEEVPTSTGRKSVDSESSGKDLFDSKILAPGASGNSKKGAIDSSLQIEGVTLENTFGFRNSVEFLQNAKAVHHFEYLTMLVMEIHVQTRGTLRPDPQHDPIRALFYTVTCDSPNLKQSTGVIAVGKDVLAGTATSCDVHYVPDEAALLDGTIDLLRNWDPDILAGYEIEMNSWGYLIQRSFVLDRNLLLDIGRIIPIETPVWKEMSQSQNEDFDDTPKNIRNLRVPGRIVLDVWRLLRHEVALTSYTFENVMYHLAHERHPRHSYQTLSQLWELRTHRLRHVTFDYYVTRVEGTVRLLEQLDFAGRTSELARLFGIQFYEVLSRGSQFRVESMMLRLAKPLNFIPVSPSIQQRAAMRAPASLPLIMEPESKFYSDPVIVLDFQSLYPSMIIAYNYCFSTCLGRVELLGGSEPFEFGCNQLHLRPEDVKSLENDVHISPAGVAFVKKNVRKGVLPRMLQEILDTRLMVKKSMKDNKGNKPLQKVLHARQLGLKLIANVTYGYTAANFSGRMPCIEVGDSVVSKGRETLQRAIQLVKSTPRWGAQVVYGDTDSMFVLTPGKTRKEAFEIGAEIADAVTQDNPVPVKLKLEKVYQPCILQTKKRYVGNMYESPDQEEPVYDAKGIETVRRDGCPATAKILQKALQLLFKTKDISIVKKYSVRQFSKLFYGRVNIQDLIFAKEYRGRRGYRPGACVPALELARRWTSADKRAEPRVKERVPYVIVNGPPGVPLIKLVRSPYDLISDSSLRINAAYYITKAIVPPMQRCFSLLGADVMSWYSEMPRKYHKTVRSILAHEKEKKSTISQYFSMVECVACSQVTNSSVCLQCQTHPQKLALVINEKIRLLERSYGNIMKVCQSCCGRTAATDCLSLDCPVLFRRHQSFRDMDQVVVLREVIENHR